MTKDDIIKETLEIVLYQFDDEFGTPVPDDPDNRREMWDVIVNIVREAERQLKGIP